MRIVRRLPAEVFAAVTTRLGGEIRFILLGKRVVLAWRGKSEPS